MLALLSLNSANIFNMLKKRIFFVIIVFIIGCKEDTENDFYALINDNFLSMVDTTAYKTGRLIQIPNDTVAGISFEKICIKVEDQLRTSKVLKQSVFKSVSNENLLEFKSLLEKDFETRIEKFDKSSIRNLGRFELVTSSDDLKFKKCDVLAGQIAFHQPYISQGKAIILLSISESNKSGYTNAFILRKRNGKWNIIEEFEIERW
jgi:hypothetical protein